MSKKGLIRSIVQEDADLLAPVKKKRDHMNDDSPIDTFDKMVCELAIRNLMFKRMKLMNVPGVPFKRPPVLEPYRAIRFLRMIKATGACAARHDDIMCMTAMGLINTAGVRTIVTANGLKILLQTKHMDQMKLISGCNKNTERDDYG